MKTLRKKDQHGVALITVLVILVVSLVLGISGMTSSQLQERMSGNQRNSVAALMAAEAGLTNAPRIIGQKISAGEPVTSCDSDPWWDTIVSWNGSGSDSGDISVQQNVAYTLQACVSDNDKYRLRSEGVVFAGDGADSEIVVSRWIVAEGFTFSGFLGFSTIMNLGGFDLPDDDFWAGGGNLTVSGRTVDGVYNDAVAVPVGDISDSLTQTEYAVDAIESTKGSVEYNGGVSEGISESMMRDPQSFYDFIFGQGSVLGLKGNADNVIGEIPTDFGSVGVEKITYIDGDFQDAGNFSGAGVMVVKGNAEFRGTPSFTGLLIVLGDYTIGTGGPGGGGGTGPFTGSLVVSPFLTYEKFLAENDVTDSDQSLCGGERCYIDDGPYYYENNEGYLASYDTDTDTVGWPVDGPAISYDSAKISLGQGNANYQYSVDALKAAENALPVELKEWVNVSNISDNNIDGFAIDRWQELLSINEEGGWPN